MASVIELDLHEWLPGWGENQVTTRSEGGNFVVDVTFDGKNGNEETRSLVFSRACFFSVGSFPGVEGVRFDFDYSFETGKLLEIKDSGLSAAWNDHWKSSSLVRECRHFLLFFGSENKVIHVVAESSEVI